MIDIPILYVEDEEDIREGVKELLQRKFKQFYVADNGKTALLLYLEHRPDIVITDINLPELSGIELARQIKTINNETQIIFTTGVNDSNILQEAIRLGVNNYILKPIEFCNFLQVVEASVESISNKKQIKNYYKNLEQKVKERTFELENLNLNLQNEINIRLKTEQSLLETNEKLREIDKLKTDFLSNISHEIRTPLTSVLGFSKLISTRLEQSVFPLLDKNDEKINKNLIQIRKNLDIIIEEGSRLTNLINDVLDLAKFESGKIYLNKEMVFLPELLQMAMKKIEKTAESKDITFLCDFEKHLPLVCADEQKIIQVIYNLLSNAVKFSEKGTIFCNVYSNNGSVELNITDNGPGIPKDFLDVIFEKFKQIGDLLTDKPSGTGLGLPISKQIIDLHNGKIWVESELNFGSTFYFSLPINNNNEFKRIVTKKTNDFIKQINNYYPIEQKQKQEILIVDDDETFRRLLKEELNYNNYVIYEAKNGLDALDTIKIHKPDVIILDILMPILSGIDAATILKNDAFTSDIPIIMLSALDSKQEIDKSLVDKYLTKPVTMQELQSNVVELMSKPKPFIEVVYVHKETIFSKEVEEIIISKGLKLMKFDNCELALDYIITDNPHTLVIDAEIAKEFEIVKKIRLNNNLNNLYIILLTI